MRDHPERVSARMISLLQFDGYVLFAAVAVMLFAGLVHGTLGLGFPMVATPILATMMDVRSAILVTLLPTMAVNIASIFNSRDSLTSTRVFAPLIGFTLLGSVAGAAILALAMSSAVPRCLSPCSARPLRCLADAASRSRWSGQTCQWWRVWMNCATPSTATRWWW